MALQQHLAHPHPLEFNKDSEDYFKCEGCMEKMFGPCYRCKRCRFYLHKKCAEAPMEIDVHPFHRHHPLRLSMIDGKRCSLCLAWGKQFMYDCSSCEFYLHIDCSLLLRDAARNSVETKFPFADQHPLILLPIANDNMHLRDSKCSGCLAPLLDAPSYACLDCQTLFHKTCVEIPTEINHPCHRKHQLILQFDKKPRDCNLCERKLGVFFYRCSLCNVSIHNKCEFPPVPIIEDTSLHEHPFTRVLRPKSFTCDACATQGNNVSYVCSTCDIHVHQKCISLPRIIGTNLHHHTLQHKCFLCVPQHDSKTWGCQICFQEVNTEYGSYYCSKADCNFVVHVNCAMDDENREWYGIRKFKNQDEVKEHFEKSESLYNKYGDCITDKINVRKDGIATGINHISHEHNLTFSNEIKDNKYCNGCILPMLSSFYYCSNCDFFLHKDCAELPKRLQWFRAPFTLHINGIFNCYFCQHVCSGFSYKSEGDEKEKKYDDDDDNDDDDDYYGLCLRCARISHSFIYKAHESHHVFLDAKYEGHCSACGSDEAVSYRSKDGDFALDKRCLTLPRTVWHKCDEHSLTLAYQDDNVYQLQHYCDICEKVRDPKYWFYHCKDCNTVAHPKCVLEEYPFIKLGTTCTTEKHPHPLTFVRKMYYYPPCKSCGEPCEDLSAECRERGCNFIVHYSCIQRDSDSGRQGWWRWHELLKKQLLRQQRQRRQQQQRRLQWLEQQRQQQKQLL